MGPNCEHRHLICPRRNYLEAENERLRAAIKAQCHRLEHDYNAADVTEARRALMAAAAS